MRFILGAIMAAAIAGVAFVQPAEARCFADGVGVTCVHHAPAFPFAYRHYYRDYGPIYRDWY